MGDGEDPAAIDQREDRGAEPRLHRDAIGAVAVEQQRGRAVQRLAAAHQHRHRDRRAIASRRVDAPCFVARGVVAGGDVLGLAQDRRAGGQTVVEGLARGGGRGIDVADRPGVVFEAGFGAQHIGRLVLRDLPLGAAIARGDDDAGVRLDPFEPDDVVFQREGADEVAARPVRHEVAPVRTARGIERRLDQLEIHRAVGIGADDQPVAGIIDIVAQAGLARGDERGRRGRVVAGDAPDLAGVLVAGGDEDRAAGQAGLDAEKEAGIGLGVHERVAAIGEGAAEHLGRPAVIVAEDPEDEARAGGKGEIAAAGFDRRGGLGAGFDLADMDAVDFRPLGVFRPREQAVVFAVRDRRGGEEGMALRARRQVEQHLFGAAGAGRAGDDRMLGARIEAAVIGVGAVRRGHGRVVVLDPALHFGEQRRLEVLGAGEHGVGIGVLGNEMGADLGIEGGGVAQHRLPVGIAQPGIVIGPHPAELFDADRLARGGRRGGLGRVRRVHGGPTLRTGHGSRHRGRARSPRRRGCAAGRAWS